MKKPQNITPTDPQATAQSIKPLDEQAAPAPAVDEKANGPNVEIVPQPVVTHQNGQAVAGKATTASPSGSGDTNMLYGSVTKSWTSGGVAGTGALKATIVATYPVSKNLTTGLTGFVGTTFALSFFDVDHRTKSTIPSYAYVFRGKTKIPLPEDGGDFVLRGTVSIISQSGWRLLSVDFDMSGDAPLDAGSTPRSIGPIFMLDIPEDTKFAPLEQLATV